MLIIITHNNFQTLGSIGKYCERRRCQKCKTLQRHYSQNTIFQTYGREIRAKN